MIKNTHSKIGASTCERWWNCPGSVAAIAKLPPQPESEYAREGTAAHEMAQKCLINDWDAQQLVGGVAENGVPFTDEMAEAVQVYLETIRRDSALEKGEVDLYVERKFQLNDVDEEAYGTNDAMLYSELKSLRVYDYKHGQGVAVDVKDNKQLLFYAVGGMEVGDFTQLELIIVQPRADHREGRVRRYPLTVTQLLEFKKELKERIASTRVPDAPLIAGAWCKKSFCPNMPTCPAVKNMASNAAMVAFSGHPVKAPEEVAEGNKLKAPEQLNAFELRRVLEAMPVIDAWLSSVYNYAENLLKLGIAVPGFKLVRGREGNRKWADEKKVVEYFGDKAQEKVVLSPAKLEKLLDKETKKKVDKFTVREEGKISMVPESDSREAVQSHDMAAKAFLKKDKFDEINSLFS